MTTASPARAVVQRHASGRPREPGSRGEPSAAVTLGEESEWLACGHLLRPADEAEIVEHLDWIAERAALLRACPAVRAAGLETTCARIERRAREAQALLRGEG